MIQVPEWSKQKPYRILVGKIPICPDTIYRPPPKPTEIPLQEIPRNLMDLDMDITMNFQENSPCQEGVISEIYQRPERAYFQETPELDSLVNTGKLVQKVLLKQTDIDKILKIIQRKVLNGIHLAVTVK